MNSSIYPSSGPTQLRSSSLKDFKIACIFIAKNTTTTTTTVTPKPTIPPNQQPLPIKECSDYVDLTIDNNSDNNKTMSTPQQTSDQENTVQEDILNEPSSDDVSDSSDSLRSLGTKRSRVPGIIPPQLPRGGLTTKLRRMRRRQLLEAVGMIPLNNTTTTTGGEGTTTSLSSVTLLPTERVIFLSDNSSASSNETSSLTMNTNTPQRRQRQQQRYQSSQSRHSKRGCSSRSNSPTLEIVSEDATATDTFTPAPTRNCPNLYLLTQALILILQLYLLYLSHNQIHQSSNNHMIYSERAAEDAGNEGIAHFSPNVITLSTSNSQCGSQSHRSLSSPVTGSSPGHSRPQQQQQPPHNDSSIMSSGTGRDWESHGENNERTMSVVEACPPPTPQELASMVLPPHSTRSERPNQHHS